MHSIELPADYALVLHQVEENGQEDFENLVESLRFDRRRLAHIIQALQSKRLIHITRSAQDSWISLSSRGRRVVSSIWPESRLHYF